MMSSISGVTGIGLVGLVGDGTTCGRMPPETPFSGTCVGIDVGLRGQRSSNPPFRYFRLAITAVCIVIHDEC